MDHLLLLRDVVSNTHYNHYYKPVIFIFIEELLYLINLIGHIQELINEPTKQTFKYNCNKRRYTKDKSMEAPMDFGASFLPHINAY